MGSNASTCTFGAKYATMHLSSHRVIHRNVRTHWVTRAGLPASLIRRSLAESVGQAMHACPYVRRPCRKMQATYSAEAELGLRRLPKAASPRSFNRFWQRICKRVRRKRISPASSLSLAASAGVFKSHCMENLPLTAPVRLIALLFLGHKLAFSIFSLLTHWTRIISFLGRQSGNHAANDTRLGP